MKKKAKDREVSAELSDEILAEYQISAEPITEVAEEPVGRVEDVAHAFENQTTTPELTSAYEKGLDGLSASMAEPDPIEFADLDKPKPLHDMTETVITDSSKAVSSSEPEAMPPIDPEPLQDVTKTTDAKPVEAEEALSERIVPTASAATTQEKAKTPSKTITPKSDPKEKKKTLSKKKKKSGKPSKRVKFEMDKVLAAIPSSHTSMNENNVPPRGTPRMNSTESLWLYPLHAMCDNCLKPFSPGHTTVWSPFLHCNHTFHQSCVLTDLLDDPKCPLCKLAYIEHKAISHDTPVEDGNSSEATVQ
jgi:hypothetical protein